jgi:hypothetical protein
MRVLTGSEKFRPPPLLTQAGTNPNRNLIWHQLTDSYTHTAPTPRPPGSVGSPGWAAPDNGTIKPGPAHRHQQCPAPEDYSRIVNHA